MLSRGGECEKDTDETSDIESDDGLDPEFESFFATMLDINRGHIEALLDKVGGVP